MTESTTYQRILREGREEGLIAGRIEEARRIVSIQARIRFGEPDAAARKALDSIESVERIETIGQRLIGDPGIAGWDDLLREV